MKKILLLSVAFFAAGAAFGQLNPVKWSYEASQVSAGEYDLVFTAHIQNGWYVYSQFLDSDEGPIPTSFSFEENAKIELVGKATEKGDKHEGYDELFMMNIVKFSGEPTYTQRIKVHGETQLTGYLEFMTCDNQRCLPPKEVTFVFTLK
jgi:cytochrome c biogenesis DsbD-like protein